MNVLRKVGDTAAYGLPLLYSVAWLKLLLSAPSPYLYGVLMSWPGITSFLAGLIVGCAQKYSLCHYGTCLDGLTLGEWVELTGDAGGLAISTCSTIWNVGSGTLVITHSCVMTVGDMAMKAAAENWTRLEIPMEEAVARVKCDLQKLPILGKALIEMVQLKIDVDGWESSITVDDYRKKRLKMVKRFLNGDFVIQRLPGNRVRVVEKRQGSIVYWRFGVDKAQGETVVTRHRQPVWSNAWQMNYKVEKMVNLGMNVSSFLMGLYEDAWAFGLIGDDAQIVGTNIRWSANCRERPSNIEDWLKIKLT